jgi:hypothetical protein
MAKAIHDPANYRKMCEPFESYDAAVAAVEKFYDEVSEARKRHKIPDVLIAFTVNFMTPEGEAEMSSHGHIGSVEREEGLAAYTYARAKADRDERVARRLKPRPT